MPDDLDPSYHPMLVYDVEGYSKRSDLEQRALRADLLDLMADACGETGIDDAGWIRQDRGDGELVLLPAEVTLPRIVADLTQAIEHGLRRRNKLLRPEHRLRLRLAVHTGEALVGQRGFAGADVIVVSRLADSDELRQVLAKVPDASLAVMVSERVYGSTVLQGHRGLDSADWGQVRIRTPKFDATAWYRALGYPPPSVRQPTDEGVSPGTGPDGEDATEGGSPGGPRAGHAGSSTSRVLFGNAFGQTTFGDNSPAVGRDLNNAPRAAPGRDREEGR